jgi:glutamine synthetase
MDIAQLQQTVTERGILFLDLKVADLLGFLHHVTLPVDRLDDRLLLEGVGFDGSSYGFSGVEHSDMILLPDLDTCFVDPFRQQPTLACLATIHLTDAARTPFAEDPRRIAQKAEDRLRALGIADRSLWGPEYEFYVFDRLEVRDEEGWLESHIVPVAPITGKGYHAETPRDAFADFRSEVCSILRQWNIPVKYHHHEGGAWGQNEIEVQLEPLLPATDHAILIKYALKNAAAQRGWALTWMPKPLYGHPGNGWHVHVLLQKDGQNLFYREPSTYAHLSETAFCFIGGVLEHARSLCAITNPCTNSYKRLVPGFEAPVTITFGGGNRSSACRIPLYVASAEEIRFEYRPPDATANPYLCLSALLQAGIDGIERGIDACREGYGPFETDLFSPEMANKVAFLPETLSEAVQALEEDSDYLLAGDVFPRSLLERWLELKRLEAREGSLRPHPTELKHYF